MKKLFRILLTALLFILPAHALADTRALLVACSDFVSQPDLGSAVSGNLHMFGSALLGVSPRLAGLSIEDGTIGTADALSASIADAFADADEDDFSLVYLCTHGVVSSDDSQTYLLLSDGERESAISGAMLAEMLSPIQGEKLLIVDACYSGAILGREPSAVRTPDEAETANDVSSPFLGDPTVHVLTSADAHESSWYFDSTQLSTGAVSYFASALSTGLGLYGVPEADLDGDSLITLAEIHNYLRIALPSSTSQLFSSDANAIVMPAVKSPLLSRPLYGFSYGESLLDAADPVFEFSFTVSSETAVQYRLIDYDAGKWNWEQAKTFLDAGDTPTGTLVPGRKSRALTLTDVAKSESGYLMLQIFSLQDEQLTLCAERLIAVQGVSEDASMRVSCAPDYSPGDAELPISLELAVPAQVTVSIHSAEGELVRRLAASQLTRPAPDKRTRLYWNGRDDAGYLVQAGEYTVTAEALVCGARQKAAANVTVVR